MDTKWVVEIVAIIAVLVTGVSVIHITRTDGAILATVVGAIVFIATKVYYKSK